MKFSLFISLILHLLVLSALIFVFRVVPEMRLPEKIYSVKILRPIVGTRKAEAAKKTEVKVKEPEVKKPAPIKPKEKKVKKEPAREPVEKPLDVSVEKDLQDETALAVDAPRFPFSYYLEAIERKVSQNWYSGAFAGGEGFSCVVYFRLRRDGTVTDISTEKGSGNAYFDRAALRAVKSAAPFPPLPRAFSESYLGIHFTFLQKD